MNAKIVNLVNLSGEKERFTKEGYAVAHTGAYLRNPEERHINPRMEKELAAFKVKIEARYEKAEIDKGYVLERTKAEEPSDDVVESLVFTDCDSSMERPFHIRGFDPPALSSGRSRNLKSIRDHRLNNGSIQALSAGGAKRRNLNTVRLADNRTLNPSIETNKFTN